ncbi:MAG: Crp/Fnr family transcriptional regulator [Hyphomicrobiales bacterium]
MLGVEVSDWIDLSPDLEPDYVRKLAQLGQVQTFGKGEHIYHQGDAADNVYVLKAGAIKATHVDENGHEWLLRLHGPGSVMGIEAIRPAAYREAKLIALEEVETICFGHNEFLAHVRADGNLGVILAQLLVKRIQMLHSRVGGFVGYSVEQRLAGILLQLDSKMTAGGVRGDTPVLKISHEELATLILSQRQYVTAILRSFATEGFIENRRRAIRILNPEGLSEIFSGGNASLR